MKIKPLEIQRSAVLSGCQKHRYELRRVWEPSEGMINIIGLNPSTADGFEDDPTIRRCIGFARDWGYGGFIMTNLFSYRLTDSRQLRYVKGDLNGLDAKATRIAAAREAVLVVAAWGSHDLARIQGLTIQRELAAYDIQLKCIKQTQPGVPWHPLYLPGNLKPIDFQGVPA